MSWLKNWKTTLAGLIAAGAYGGVTAAQQGNLEPNQIALAAGIAVIAALAKDHDVTGGK
jgi:hypothetical protein